MQDVYYYVSVKQLGLLYLYLSAIVGPGEIQSMINSIDVENQKKTLKDGDIIQYEQMFVYLDPLRRNGVAFFKCEKEDMDSIKKEIQLSGVDENIINGFLAKENIFLLHGMGSNAFNIEARLLELTKLVHGGFKVISTKNEKEIESTKNVEYIPSIEISDSIISMESETLKKWQSLTKGTFFEKKVEKVIDGVASKEETNFAYSCFMISGYLQGRKHHSSYDKKDDVILQNLCDKVDAAFFSKEEDPLLRINRIGMRHNALSFIVWAYNECGITNAKELLSNFDSISKDFANSLEKDGYQSAKHLKYVKEMLECIA